MRIGFCLMALGVGLLLRCAVMSWHDTPRGDVLLDVSVARSVAAGEGYASGFHRGMAFVVGDGPVPPQDRADQHDRADHDLPVAQQADRALYDAGLAGVSELLDPQDRLADRDGINRQRGQREGQRGPVAVRSIAGEAQASIAPRTVGL